MAYDQFILFGDSITQESGTQERGFGFARALQNGWYIGCSFLFLFDADLILYSDIEQAYIRRLDIVNRGLRYAIIKFFGKSYRPLTFRQRLQHGSGCEGAPHYHSISRTSPDSVFGALCIFS